MTEVAVRREGVTHKSQALKNTLGAEPFNGVEWFYPQLKNQNLKKKKKKPVWP